MPIHGLSELNRVRCGAELDHPPGTGLEDPEKLCGSTDDVVASARARRNGVVAR